MIDRARDGTSTIDIVLSATVAVVMLLLLARPSAGDTARPAPTPRPWGLPVYVQTDADLRIEACDGLAPVIGTRPVPLVGCEPWQSCRDCEPGRAEVGQLFILWPSVFRYRLYRPDGDPLPGVPGSTPASVPGVPGSTPACAPVVVVVTATPTDTPRPTETMELTPTAVPTRAVRLPLALQRRRGR